MIARAALVAIAGAGAVVTSAPAAATPPLDAQDGASPSLVLLDQDFGVDAGEPWRATFQLDGAIDDIVPPPTTTPGSVPTTIAAPPPDSDTAVRVVVYRPIESRAELAEAIDTGPSGAVDLFTVSLARALRWSGPDTTLQLDVPTTVDPRIRASLSLRRPGLYPIAVQLLVGDDVVAEHHTFLERRPVEPVNAAPLSVALLAAIDDPGPVPDDEELVAGRRQLAAVADLAGVLDGPMTASVPPVLLADLQADDPTLAAALRNSLSDDEALAAPAEEFDPSSAVAIEAQEAFARTLRDGEEALGTVLDDTDITRATWLAPAPTSAGAAAMLRDLDFDSLTITPDGYSRLEGNIGGFVDPTLSVDAALPGGTSLPAFIATPLGGLVDPDRSEGIGPTNAAVRILADLFTTRRELGASLRRGVVLTPPGLGVPDPDVAVALSRLMSDFDDIRLTTMSELVESTDTMIIDGTPQTVTLPPVAGPDLSDRAARVELTRVSAESAGSMQRGNDDLTRWREALDGLLSTGRSDEAVNEVLAKISAEAEAVRAAVEVPRPFDFTLTGRSSVVRLNLHNHSSEQLRVVVRASSPKLTFPEGEQLVDLAPAGVTEVEIPVEARSNGTSSIQIEVVTPAIGQRLGQPVVLTAHVNALTGLGQLLTGAALLVLGSWWFGHFRRRRRQRLAARALAGAPPVLDVVSPDAAESADDVTIELLRDTDLEDDRRGPRREPQHTANVRNQ